MLTNDTNSYGVGWNIKVKDSLDPDDAPRMHMKLRSSSHVKDLIFIWLLVDTVSFLQKIMSDILMI